MRIKSEQNAKFPVQKSLSFQLEEYLYIMHYRYTTLPWCYRCRKLY